MAEHIGDSLHLSASGSRIEQDDDGVTVHAEGIAVRAAIVAVQLAIASQIRYEPMLPGVLIEFGRALRAPCGRIHWAGTESSAVMCGWVGGAIRSGERAAAEVVQKERLGSLNLSA